MSCLDTDLLVALLRGDAEAKKFVSDNQGELRTTVITACELFHGAFKARNPRHVEQVRGLLSTLEVLPLSPDAAEKFGQLNASLHTDGKTVADFDLLIASTCIANGEVLVTRNGRHFEKIRELKTRKW